MPKGETVKAKPVEAEVTKKEAEIVSVLKERHALSPVQEYTQEERDLIRRTVAKDATEAEFQLFMYRARHLGLDPLKTGQIHFVKYGNNPGTIIVGIDGMRARAARTGKHSGTQRGVIRDDKGKLVGAWAEVYRTDWTMPAREEVPFSEYASQKPNWQKMPETMIKKVAEAAALRMAFPDEVGGLYAEEEMDQAERPAKPAKEPKPLEAKVVEPEGQDANSDDADVAADGDLPQCECGHELMVSKYDSEKLYCNKKTGGCGKIIPREKFSTTQSS